MVSNDHYTLVHRTSIAMLCAAVGATFVVGCGGGEGDREAQGTPEPPPAMSPKRLTPEPRSASPAETRPAPGAPAPDAPAPPTAPASATIRAPLAASFTP